MPLRSDPVKVPESNSRSTIIGRPGVGGAFFGIAPFRSITVLYRRIHSSFEELMPAASPMICVPLMLFGAVTPQISGAVVMKVLFVASHSSVYRHPRPPPKELSPSH